MKYAIRVISNANGVVQLGELLPETFVNESDAVARIECLELDNPNDKFAIWLA